MGIWCESCETCEFRARMDHSLYSLGKKEKEMARLWRLKKCSWDSFEMLFLKFQQEIKE